MTSRIMIAMGQAQTRVTKARTAVSNRKLRLASERRTSQAKPLKPGRRQGRPLPPKEPPKRPG